jgi:hypothetical protein
MLRHDLLGMIQDAHDDVPGDATFRHLSPRVL